MPLQIFMTRHYWPSLDGLRAFAVLIVLFAHANSPFPRSGGVGVDIFFVLSGFLITGILSAEADAFGKVNYKNFYIRRFLRLGPALVISMLVYMFWQRFTQGQFPLKQLAYVATYTANWGRMLMTRHEFGPMVIAWSLAIEEQYYLIWPAVIALLHRVYKTPKARMFFLTASALVLAFYRYKMVGIYSSERIYFGTDTHIDGLILGSALSYAVQMLKVRGGFSKKQEDLWNGVLVPLAFLGLLGIMRYSHWKDAWMGKYGFFLAAVFSAVILTSLVAISNSWIQKFFSFEPVRYLGKISYGLYLYHRLVYSVLEYFAPQTASWTFLWLKIPLAVLTAAVFYHAVEVRFLKMKEHFK